MTTQAGIYVRISSDPAGRRLGVTRQLSDCRKKAELLGWNVATVFEDNDVSASTGRARPAYERMLSDLEARRITAVVVWDLDRLTRRPIEIEHFIDLADRHGIQLASVGGDVDLSTDNGRMFARIKGAVARAEVERKSARQRAANEQRAEAGRPHAGRRTFGYSRDGLTVVEDEATEFRKAVEALLAGASLRGIVAAMNERGVLTTAGNAWKPTELRRLLTNPRHAGMRVHRGDIVGRGDWPQLIDPDTHAAVVAILSDPSRHRAGRPRRYLLSGLAICSVCGARCYGATQPHGPLYYCETRKHLAPRAEPIEKLVTDVIVGRLSEPDASQVFARPDDGDQARELRAEERGIRNRLDGLAEAFASGEIDRHQLSTGSARLRARLHTVTEALAQLIRHPALSPVLTAQDVRSAWTALDIDTQRRIVETLVTVTLHPPGRGARVFNPDDVDILWKV